ncbi:adenylate/guanylate cyclase domain-containing protein [Tritonibacter horizontis]|uniref:Adenylate and guanylate cyclase catalytic domain protein n=1 Tax=Tritonibacter horizontis TaxID=1768241 RepID=A0A132BY56_9RHOB|nr:adenylate/guanylate cyclase domain-containing protein [Tritonibacter horizontis]KUP93321.1 adenylate and guanylate cyclase catalytic domain protein [Tritonibacter horizontis]
MSDRITRKLTTILAADAEQFSAAMTADEVGTFTELQAARDVFFKLITHHGGRVANTAGDGLIADFPSVVEAVQCAIEVQQELAARDAALSFRIGVHLGDVICDGPDLIGEGVNLAARLQTMAEPGGVLISQQVYDHVKNKLTIGFEYLGDRRPRNLAEDVAVYRVSLGAPRPSRPAERKRPADPSQSARVWLDPDPFADAPQRDFRAPAGDDMADGDQQQDGFDLKGYKARFRRCEKPSKMIAGAAAGLFLLDIVTGRGIWAHWPILVLVMLFLLREGPRMFDRNAFLSLPLRFWIIGGFLFLVNMFSWSGYFWALWPIGGLFLVSLLRRGIAPQADEPQ